MWNWAWEIHAFQIAWYALHIDRDVQYNNIGLLEYCRWWDVLLLSMLFNWNGILYAKTFQLSWHSANLSDPTLNWRNWLACKILSIRWVNDNQLNFYLPSRTVMTQVLIRPMENSSHSSSIAIPFFAVHFASLRFESVLFL